MEETIDFARKHGYVETIFGRKISTSGINDSNKRVAAFAERAAINAPLQGSASDVIKLAMVRLQNLLKERGLKSKMLLQVHDELIFEVPIEEVKELSALVKKTMEEVVDFDVKLISEIGVGDNWDEAH